MTTPLDGLILLNKPAGVTSFQALRPVKALFPKKTKVGHSGTLDQFATGVLAVLVGRGTRLVALFTGFDKRYEGTLRLGWESETLDPEGHPRRVGEPPDPDKLLGALKRFRGAQTQVPPRFSAVHVGGERAYRRALRGEELTIPERAIRIYSLELLSYEPPDARIAVHCSKGTYIRALARDIAAACGTYAYLTALRRDSVGPFTLTESVDAPTLDAVIPLERVVQRLPSIREVPLAEEESRRIARGAKIEAVVDRQRLTGEEPYRGFLDPRGEVVAIAAAGDGGFRYILVRP
ncbi:MAG: tRNA pseudouridine(55) synthase TruB [Alkalispirochaetaceae bacterium]